MAPAKDSQVWRVPKELVDYVNELNTITGISKPTIMREIAKIKPITAERRKQ